MEGTRYFMRVTYEYFRPGFGAPRHSECHFDMTFDIFLLIFLATAFRSSTFSEALVDLLSCQKRINK